ncbi:N-acetyltransferase [Qipengyuania nanhaisediminis]|uniref:N-acetyltransferase n=1 Tax=Qipengyuania nanhaisediminis TaxID=604088 RepID=UPI0038B3B5BD
MVSNDTNCEIVIEPVDGKKGRARFVDCGRAFAARLEHAVPQLRSEQLEMVDPAKNPFFGHARAQLFIARRGEEAVGRISAHIDELALEMPAEQGFGPGTGMFGYFDAEDEAVAHALLDAAESWLRGEGMTRVLGPISMSVWEEPGLLVKGQDHAPVIMMGHHPAHYAGWIEAAGYERAKTLYTYDLDVRGEFPPLVQRIEKSGQRSGRITVRQVRKKDWDAEAAIILDILNDAWSDNWGFVPLTKQEVAYTGVKLKPIIHEELNMIAEIDGRPVAFMLTFPDVNHVLARTGGKLLPFGWFHLLRWLRNPTGSDMRVPLMGVLKEYQNSRVASQLAFMMISQIRRNAAAAYGSKRGEIGWILEDNQGMVAIADAINARINREYAIYRKPLS